MISKPIIIPDPKEKRPVTIQGKRELLKKIYA